MQNQGSIGPATVAGLLQTMEQERATGTLSLESDGRQCTLHFLFGHLFHAVGDGADGESAVLSVLGWRDGAYNFNPRAKLPPEETINSSTESLLARWQSGAETAEAAPAGRERALSMSSTAYPSTAEAEQADGESESWAAVRGELGQGGSLTSDIRPFQAPAPEPASPPPAVAPPLSPSPLVGAAAPAPGSAARVPTAPLPRPQPRPAPGQPAPAPRPVAGASRTQLAVLIPMPGGPSLHAGLKASFLNFPMLLKTLCQDGFSGYVRVSGELDSHHRGHILFREGEMIQAQERSEAGYRRGKAALQEIVRSVGQGQGLIDAVELPGELVASLAPLIVATTAFVNLPARIVDFEALLEYINEQRLNGGVLVSRAEQVAVALLEGGTVKGSYSNSAPELTQGSEVTASACGEREARIDVVSNPSQPLAPLDPEEIG